MDDRPILAIDPGRGKCGLAVVAHPDHILELAVAPRSELISRVRDILHRFPVETVVMGDRTGSREASRELREGGVTSIVTVPEHETTMKARARYFRDHPARGFMRLLPTGLRTPPRPVDDYAAVLLAEEYWKQQR